MGFVTNGEHDQMMRDQQRDLCRIANALEMANKLKVTELIIHHEQAQYRDQKDYDTIDSVLKKLANMNGYTIKD